MTQRILIMGLPGAGKTTFAQHLKAMFEASNKTVAWLNADDVRREYNDWDFSEAGRIRQSKRMYELSQRLNEDYVIADFVAPLQEMRNNFNADWTVWIDTIKAGRYEDTNQIFVAPEVYDFRITEQRADLWVDFVGNYILSNQRRPRFDPRNPTVQLLGRYQPWHAGHRALFERAIRKTGQVVIQVRDCQGWNGTNPFNFEQVAENIKRDLDPLFQGQYIVQLVPNIVNITYGRDVGYSIEREEFDDEIESISATKIRRELGLK